MALIKNCGLEQMLQHILVIEGSHYYIYGNEAYLLRPWIQTDFDRVSVSETQRVYNTEMSKVCVSVE